MRLLRLPDEVLEITLKSLLPPFRSQSLAETYAFTVPVDLLAARLVCRRIHHIATPFAWRRVQLQIASPAAKFYDSINRTAITANKHSLHSLSRCYFFYENPHLAVHVRVLLISLEWHAERPELARDAVRAATRAMSGLRTVLVWDADVLPFQDICDLLQRPSLRAARLMDVDGSAFPLNGGWTTSLKMMHIANSASPARLLVGAATTLECVSIEFARRCPIGLPAPTLRDMPWKTLKEVSLVDCVDKDDWSLFLEGFERHKRLARPMPLSELIIGHLNGLQPSRVSQLLRTFGGHPLRRFSLYHVLSLDPPVLEAIVSAFPTLCELTLLTEGGLAPWPSPLDMYAQKLAGLPRLMSLAWNNFELDSATDVAFPTLDDLALCALYREHTLILAGHMSTLRYVRLTSVTDGIVDTVRMRWKSDGNITIGVMRRMDSVSIHTSSWSTSSFEDI